MNIQFNIDWHGHLDISQYVREAEPKQRNADVRSAIYGRTDQNKIELYLDDDAEYAPLVRLLDFLRAIKNPDVIIYSGHGSIDTNRQYADPSPFSKQADLYSISWQIVPIRVRKNIAEPVFLASVYLPAAIIGS